MMESLCQVWRFYFQPFRFYHADRQTDRQTEAHACYTDATIPSATVMMATLKTKTVAVFLNEQVVC